MLVNNQPSECFVSQRGVRQGCRRSPYLFVLSINELSLALQETLNNSHHSSVSVGPNCPPVHSLLFADDLLICGKATVTEAEEIRAILDKFYQVLVKLPIGINIQSFLPRWTTIRNWLFSIFFLFPFSLLKPFVLGILLVFLQGQNFP